MIAILTFAKSTTVKVALEKTEEFIKANKDVIDTILTGISTMTRGGEKQ